MKPDISIIILSQNEGRHGHQTMRTLSRALERCNNYNRTIEILVIHGRSDSLTRNVYNHFTDQGIRQIVSQCAEEIMLLNAGIDASRGEHIIFIPGGHIVSCQWLESICRSSFTESPCLYVPEYEVCFGADSKLTRFLSSNDRYFDLGSLLELFHWNTGHLFASRSLLSGLLKKMSYYEENNTYVGSWSLFCEAIVQQIDISVLDKTVVFTRKPWNGKLPVSFCCDINTMKSDLFGCSSFKSYGFFENDVQDSRFVNEEIDSAVGNSKTRRILDHLSSIKNKLFGQKNIPLPTVACKTSPPAFLPNWMNMEMMELNSLEPAIIPDPSLVVVDRFTKHGPSLSWAYERLCFLCGDDVRHVFLVPWLITGGADLETINIVHALEKQGFAEQTVVIATEDVESSWRSKLPDSVRFISFGQEFRDFSLEKQDILLNRFFLQIQPDIIHNINSLHGYRLFIHNGAVLKKFSRLIVSVFCFDFLPNGARSGFAVHCLPDCYDFLSIISSDNQAFLNELHGIYGYEKSKLVALYQPCPQVPRNRVDPERSLKETGILHVLWAGRMDRQKRPDLLLEVAKKSIGLPIHFHVYGAPVLDEEDYFSQLEILENVSCYGSYNGFSSLPVHLYEVYLYTSQWDGLPNVLLEAAVSGLPIIASDVGGIHEFIEHDKNGFLVSPYDESSAYVMEFKKFLDGCCSFEDIQQNMDKVLNLKFSWERFMCNLKQFYMF